jgi:magnesium chelatase family protein
MWVVLFYLCYTISLTMKIERSVLTLLETGAQGLLVTIECSLSNNLPNIVIVGYAGKTVDEARERIRSAFTNSHLNLPRKRIIINLAPADVPKDGTSFDLGIATAILAATNQIRDSLTSTAVMGELGLDGGIHPIRGIIGKIMVGKRHGLQTFIIPAGNLEQAALVPDIRVIPVMSLLELHDYLNSSANIVPIDTSTVASNIDEEPQPEGSFTLEDVIGQEIGKRAIEISAAGGITYYSAVRPEPAKVCLPELCPAYYRHSHAQKCWRLLTYIA